MGHKEHKEHAKTPVRSFVLTVSDTRTAADDKSGALIKEKFVAAGHDVIGAEIVPDDAALIKSAVLEALDSGAQAVVVTGGTGIAARDVTVDALLSVFDFELVGFGELFRALSYEEIGSAAMMSRAVAGVLRGRGIVFCLPGSAAAVRLAVDRLILPELSHIMWEIGR